MTFSMMTWQVVPLFSLEEISAGSLIFQMGSPGDKVYILLHGSINIMKGKLVLATLKSEQGQSSAWGRDLPVFGEMAMLDRSPRIAAALAVSDCKLLTLPMEQFAATMLIIPDMKARLRRLMSQRKRQNVKTETAKREADIEQAHLIGGTRRQSQSATGAPSASAAREGL